MSDGLHTTFEVLARVKNESAVEVLTTALKSSSQLIEEGALRALVTRRNPTVNRQIMQAWKTMPERWKELLGEHPDRLSEILREGVLGDEPILCGSACEAVVRFRDYDLMPAMITAAENSENPNADLVAQTVVDLAAKLQEEITDHSKRTRRRDPNLVRHRLLASVEGSVRRFPKHQRKEMIETFLILSPRNGVLLLKILEDPHAKAYLSVVDLMNHSQQLGVIQLVVNFLDAKRAPLGVLNVLSHRHDLLFLKRLMKKVGYEPSADAAANLQRIEHFPWLEEKKSTFKKLEGAEQHAAVRMVMRSGIPSSEKWEILTRVLDGGQPVGRMAAIEELAQFTGDEANQLALKLLDDGDPQVVALVIPQLRKREIPGAVKRLLALHESPHQVVTEAVLKSLPEFQIDHFLSSYHDLDEATRRSTGLLVKMLDPSAAPRLKKELAIPSRNKQLTALEVAEATGLLNELEESLLALMQEEDLVVRTTAATAAGQSNSSTVHHALQELQQDRNVAVQNAALKSLKEIEQRQQAEPDSLQQPNPIAIDDHLLNTISASTMLNAT